MGTINFEGVGKRFARSRQAEPLVVFDDLNLNIEVGKTLAIVGPSGCGKTTLLNLLAELEPLGTGTITYPGWLDRQSRSLGYLFQRDALLPWRTALGNALLGVECLGEMNGRVEKRAGELFRRFGLQGFEQAWPDTLSGGQRQRVALIQNLLVDPDILLLDEPFGSLDYQTKLLLEEELLGVIRTEDGAGRRKTVVFVTHDIEEAVTLGDRVIVLGALPRGIVQDLEVNLEEKLRNPLAARRSDVMRDLFGRIWAELRDAATKYEQAEDHSTRPRTSA